MERREAMMMMMIMMMVMVVFHIVPHHVQDTCKQDRQLETRRTMIMMMMVVFHVVPLVSTLSMLLSSVQS